MLIRGLTIKIRTGAVILLLISFLMSSFSVDSKEDDNVMTLGRELVTKLWEDIKNGDESVIRSVMAPGFQSGYSDKARNVEQELKLLTAFPIESFELKDLSVTRNQSTIITTYTVHLDIHFMGRLLASDPSSWMSIFVENEGKWKWMGHARLK